MGRFIVYGATGTVGRPLTEILLRRGNTVVAPMRTAHGQLPRPTMHTEVVDLADFEALRRLSDGADAAFVLVGSNPDQVAVECRYIDAAAAAGVPRIVKLSAPDLPGQPPMLVAGWHRQVERHLVATGLEHASIQPMAFHQNWLRNTTTIQRFNMIAGSAGDAVRNYVDAADVADVAANLLETHADLPAIVPVAGPHVYSYAQVAALLSEVIGRSIRYKDMDPQAHHRMLVKRARMPEWLADHVVELDTLARSISEQPSNDIPRLLGRPARTLSDFLTTSADAFDQPPWHHFLTNRRRRTGPGHRPKNPANTPHGTKESGRLADPLDERVVSRFARSQTRPQNER
ncbi:MAG: NAD(P)H-binding protein [Actinomycetota bacterium]